jgi:hypothetical protein
MSLNTGFTGTIIGLQAGACIGYMSEKSIDPLKLLDVIFGVMSNWVHVY